MSVLKTLTVNGTTYRVVPVVPTNSVTLLASGWVGSEGSYSQVVALSGVTSHTKVDLQPTPEQVEIFLAKTLAFVTENANGVVTVFSIGDKPTNNYTIQVTMTEVEGASPIRGNTVGLPNPSPDWTQSDSRKADFIRNKPDIAAAVEAALQKAKDSGEFDGAPGEPGPAGPKGDPGEAGPAGKNGVSPEILVHPTDGGYTITITDERGTEEFTLLHGKDSKAIYIPLTPNAYIDHNSNELYELLVAGNPVYVANGGFLYSPAFYTPDTIVFERWYITGDWESGFKIELDRVSIAGDYMTNITHIIVSNNGSGDIDLAGYAKEAWVQAGFQPKGDYLASTALPTAINTALAQAKASGEFKGDKGDKGDTGPAYTLTSADKTAIVNAVIAALPVYNGEVI